MTVNEADIWLVGAPSLMLALGLWVMELRRLPDDVSVLGLLLCLIRGGLWTALLFVVALVVSVISEGIYCEDCSTRLAGAAQLFIDIGYLIVASVLMGWAVGRIRAGTKGRTNPELNPDQEAIAVALSPEQVARVDEALVAQASRRGRKVAMIVALTIADSGVRVPGLPEVYYARRVKELVRQGRLVAEGQLDSLGYGEVRLP